MRLHGTPLIWDEWYIYHYNDPINLAMCLFLLQTNKAFIISHHANSDRVAPVELLAHVDGCLWREVFQHHKPVAIGYLLLFSWSKKTSVASVFVCVLSSPESLFYNSVPPRSNGYTHTIFGAVAWWWGGGAEVSTVKLAHTHHHQHHLHPNIRMATFGEITMPG